MTVRKVFSFVLGFCLANFAKKKPRKKKKTEHFPLKKPKSKKSKQGEAPHLAPADHLGRPPRFLSLEFSSWMLFLVVFFFDHLRRVGLD